MSSNISTFRNVQTARREDVQWDINGRPIVRGLPTVGTRAVQTYLRMDKITAVIALDCEFQQVFIEGIGNNRHRVGRVSIVNQDGIVIYDVFAWYPPEPGKRKRLSLARLKLGVYAKDIKLENGAIHIDEVEFHVEAILRKAQVVVGRSIHNDNKVFSDHIFRGIKTWDTQLYEPYRIYAIGTQRLPKLSVLSASVLKWNIQGEEHSSVEDAQATMQLYRRAENGIEAEQRQGTDWRLEYGYMPPDEEEANQEYEDLPGGGARSWRWENS